MTERTTDFDAGRRSRGYGHIVFLLSVVGLLAEVTIAVTTILPGAPLLPELAPLVFIPGVFIVHLKTISRLRDSRSQGDTSLAGAREATRRLIAKSAPADVSRVLSVYLVIAVVATIAALIGLRHGVPTEVNGRYFQDSHGVYTPVTLSGYLSARASQQRLLALVLSMFYALGVLTSYPTSGRA